jgi:predicted nucleic acid-binding protein
MSTSSLVYLDTNPFIYAFELDRPEPHPAAQLFIGLQNHPKSFATSELTLAELLAPPARPNERSFEQKARLYVNLLIWSGMLNLVPVARHLLIGTAMLRQKQRYKLPDAIHVVSALAAGCKFFVSNNIKCMGNLPEGLKLVLPDTAGVAAILGALDA